MTIFWEGEPITRFILSFTWSGTDTQASRSLDFSVIQSDYDPYADNLDIKLGDRLTLYRGEEMLFYGRITSKDGTTGSGNIHYIAQDYMNFLLRSTGTYEFYNKTAEQITKLVCADANVDTEDVIRTGIAIDDLYFSNRPFYEIILAAYTKAAAKNGKKYMPTMVGRKFSMIEKGKKIKDFYINESERIIDASFSESTQNMVNQVKVYDSMGRQIGEAKNDTWVKEHGVYQSGITVDEGSWKSEAENTLQGVEKTASLTCLGDVRCLSGWAVGVKDTISGITGKYWIQSDSHTWDENGNYTMTLELAFKNVMETFEPDEKPQEQTELTAISASSSGKILNGQKVRAKFTAYYPANNAMEGGFYDAYGVLLSDWTAQGVKVIAAPPSIAKDTMIQVLETGTDKDGTEWRVRDRGGAIQIEAGNVYHFDLLMSSAAECNNWGVKMGYAIIGNGTGYQSTGSVASGSKAEAATAQMEAWANDNSHGYSQANRWGPDYDCSSAVIQAYENAGVLVKSRGATYTGNMYSVFLACGFQDVTASCNLGNGSGMKRGDVLLNHVHHTAMYCGNGQMVHARGASLGSSAQGDWVTGNEFAITGYSNYPWNCVLRYNG